MHLLFVCTGNICRSPTAERLSAAWAVRAGVPALSAGSAGTRALVDHPIHPDAVSVLEKLGGDPSNFAARRFSPRIASTADLILTMTKEHQTAVLEIAPNRLRSTFTLGEAALLAAEHQPASVADLADLRPQLARDAAPEVADPIGQDPAYFSAIGAQIIELLTPVLELCRRSVGQA